MSEETMYTVFVAKSHVEDDDQVIARGLSLRQAAKVVSELDGSVSFTLDQDHGSFRAFEFRKLDAKMRLVLSVGATVPSTEDAAQDRKAAERMIDIQIVARSGEFGECRVIPEFEFKRRMQLVAERRAAIALEKSIVTDLVDRLLEEGYRITACARWDKPRFRNSRQRDGILNLLFDLEMADLIVSRNGDESWISLVFGEDGWDVIADYSTDLAHLIDPIVEPRFPWNRPGGHDPGYAVITLPSTAQLESGDPKALDTADAFFSGMEKIFG